MLQENQLGVQDTSYNYDNGLWDFEADCTTPGHTTTIKLYYYDITTAGQVFRKFDPRTKIFYTLGDATITTQTINSHNVLVVTYQITDGGVFDTNGLVDGMIKDPAGIATAVSSATGTLAATGNNANSQAVLATIILSSGVILVGLSRFRRRRNLVVA